MSGPAGSRSSSEVPALCSQISETVFEAPDPFAGTGPALGYLLLDVFSAAPLQGNQLAVFDDGRDLTADAMQAIACELKLSETVFLLPAEAGGDARARIF